MKLHDFCGLDFGTSNSTIGIFDGKQIQMVPLEDNKPTLRSAIFFDYDNHRVIFGQKGITDYLTGGHGRLMMSLKSILGSSLMKEKTYIDTRWVTYTDILEHLLRYIKTRAEALKGDEITHVVMGRPVRFHDTDDERDRLAEKTLEKVAHQIGFKSVYFQFEPIAAALAYEHTLQQEQIAFIVDLGGGTSDFSVIRLNPGFASQSSKRDRQQDVLSNQGIHIGGTDLDTRFSLKLVMPHLGLGGKMRGITNIIEIPSSFYHELTTWHTINGLYTHKTRRAIHDIAIYALEKEPIHRLLSVIEKQEGHRILNEVELAKCALSDDETAILNMDFIENNFIISTKKLEFEEVIRDKVEDLMQTIAGTVKASGLKPEAIDSIFFTGGTTQIPAIRNRIQQFFPSARVVKGDVFSSVGKGLILDAARRFS